MKVLVLTPTNINHLDSGGGVAITFDTLKNKLVEKGHEVIFITSWDDTIKSHSFFLYKSFKCFSFSFHNIKFFIKKIRNCDVVLMADDNFAILISLLCCLFKKKIILGIHTNVELLFSSRVKNIFLKNLISFILYFHYFILKHFSFIYTTSDEFRDILNKKYNISSHVLSPQLEYNVFTEFDENEKIQNLKNTYMHESTSYLLLYAGRFSKEKRIDLLIKTKPDNCTLLIIGDGEDRDDINKFSNDKDIKVINKMFTHPELRLFYKAADFTVSASNFETFGMTCYESLICKTPVISQLSPGYREQIKDSHNGYLINFDNISESKKKILIALNNKDNLNPRIIENNNYLNIEQILNEANIKKHYSFLKRTCSLFLFLISWPFLLILQYLFFV